MAKKYSLLCSLILCLTAGAANGNLTDRRSLARNSEAVRFELSDSKDNPLRLKKPRLKGNYRVAGKTHRKAMARVAPSAYPTIYANIVDYAPNDEVGIYKFTPASYEFTAVTTDDSFALSYGSTYYNGTFLGIDDAGNGFTWNTDNWSMTSGPVTSTMVKGTAMASDPTDGTIYSCAYAANGMTTELVTVDPSNFTRISTITPLSASFSALVFDLKGNLYGFESTGKLYSIDKNSGSLTYLGDTGVEAMFDGAAVIDPDSGICFYAATDWECGLYEVDLATCEAKLIYEFDDEEDIKSLFILPEAPDAGSPAAADNFRANFAGGALEGTLSFNAPTLTYGGAPGSGELNYTLTCNDTELQTGSCAWGEEITIAYTAPATGSYSFVVTMNNQVGESRPTAKSLWIGNDIPADPSDVKVTRINGANIISWKAPATSIHGGYVAFDEITYQVTRYPDSKVVAEDLTGCEFTDNLDDGNAPELYYYTVTALWNGTQSGAVSSNDVMVGAVYYNSFDDQTQFDEFMSVSLVKDGPEWTYASWHKAATVSCNEEANVSAWLISPAIELTGGQTYTLSFDVWCSNDSYTENLSVFLSTSNIPGSIYSTTPLIDKMNVNWESYAKKTITAEYTPEDDGTYYLTFNGCSGRDLGSLYVDNVLLYRNVTVALPEAPVISGQIMGGLIALITFTAPDTDTDGNTLDAIDLITVSRNGETVYTVENPEPGETYNFIDMLPEPAAYTYTAVAFTQAGRSAEGMTIVSLIDVGKPRQATITAVTETGNTGEVTVEWEAPSTDLNNQPIEPGTLTYSIYTVGSDDPVATGLTETSYTWQAVENGAQAFLSFYIVASNEAGDSSPSRVSEPRPFGTPDTAPYSESFSDMQTAHLWDFYNADDYSDGHWLFVAESETPLASPYDNDGGMMAFEGEFLEDTAWATTGKIDLGSGSSPRLTLWYFAVNAREGKDQLDIMVSDGSGYRCLDSFTMRDIKLDGWTKRTVDLSAYAGKVITLRLVGTSFRTGNLMLIDKIEITTLDKDVEAYALVAPASVLPGKKFYLDGVIVNNGIDLKESFTATLLRDGEEVAKETVSAIAAGGSGVVTFTQEADASWKDNVTYRMEINLPGDQYPDNNNSEEVTVRVVPCTLPTVSDLQAVYTSDDRSDVRLSWSAPDASILPPAPYTENFEYYEPYEINPENDWHFIDGDGDVTYGSQTFPFEGMSDPKAYIVLDSDNFNLTYTAHSGNRYLASFSATTKRNDDWMISPELYGGEQTISLFARSYTSLYGLEEFEILASSTGIETSDFSLVKEFKNVPEEWTEFTADLPEGTRYFAIRCTSQNTFMFFVDDVTYIPAVNPATKFNVLGFNVFCNGERINPVTVFGMSYSHSPASDIEPEYAVSVIYDHGESGLSEGVTPAYTSVESVTSGSLSVRAVTGGIEFIGSGNVVVLTADGRILFTGSVEGSFTVPVIPGIYLAGASDSPVKVAVR